MALGWRSGYLRYKDFFLNILLIYKKRPDIKMFLEAGLSLITIFIFSVFALRPTLITVASLVREIRSKEETVVKMEEKIANLDAAETVFSQEEQRMSVVRESVPQGPEPDSFLRQIEGLSRGGVQILGVSFQEMTLSGKEPERKTKEELKGLPKNAKALSFSVSATGDYNGLAKFLAEVENLRRPLKIDAAGINSSQTPEGTTLTLVISARTPYIQNE